MKNNCRWQSPVFSIVLLLAAATPQSAVPQPADATHEAVNQVLDQLHANAAASDFDSYFALFTDDAVFMGTDLTERWSIADLMNYARPRFEAGQGWVYTATGRNIFVSADGQTAWFDETLENANLGTCRGTGVLVHGPGGWKITQYSLSVPIPNALVRGVVEQIRSADP